MMIQLTSIILYQPWFTVYNTFDHLVAHTQCGLCGTKETCLYNVHYPLLFHGGGGNLPAIVAMVTPMLHVQSVIVCDEVNCLVLGLMQCKGEAHWFVGNN